MTIIAILGDNLYLGLRCAKRAYGVDLVEELLRGRSYNGRDGQRLLRMTEGELREDELCEKCMHPLFLCNASEVTV